MEIILLEMGFLSYKKNRFGCLEKVLKNQNKSHKNVLKINLKNSKRMFNHNN